MIMAKTFDHFSKGSGECHCDADTLTLAFSSVRSQHHSVQSRTMKIHALYLELIDELVASTVVGMKELKCAPVTSLSLLFCLR